MFTNNPEKLMDLIKTFQNDRPVRVFPTADAPQHVLDGFGTVSDNGFKVVSGQHIGHEYRSDLPSLADVGQAVTKMRRVASAVGINSQLISGADTGAATQMRVMQELTKLQQNDPTFTMPVMLMPVAPICTLCSSQVRARSS